jgi:RpiB/LacA/LacB family sugar-phosphate isomerase
MTARQMLIAADHAGYILKEDVKRHLQKMGLAVVDAGTQSCDPVDYPDYGAPVARSVSSGDCDRGILICGSGIGMSIVANKFPNVRAALCLDEDMAIMSRLHNDSNILILAARKTDAATARGIVEIWLNTGFEGGRHIKRIEKIKEIEQLLKK